MRLGLAWFAMGVAVSLAGTLLLATTLEMIF